METFHNLYLSLTNNQLDRLTLMVALRKYEIKFTENEESDGLELKLKLFLVENLLNDCRDPSEAEKLSSLYCETRKMLCEKGLLDMYSYKCTVVGCIFKTSRHREYLRHLGRIHVNGKNLKCNYKNECSWVFQSLTMLKEHVDIAHQKKVHVMSLQSYQAYVSLSCPILKCGGLMFENLQKLSLHMRNFHIKNGENIECVIDGCQKRFDKADTFRKHLDSKHLRLMHDCSSSATVNFVEDGVISTCRNEARELVETTLSDNEDLILTNDGESDVEISEQTFELEVEDNDDMFLKSHCDFLNRQVNFNFVPNSTVTMIGLDYLNNYRRSNKLKMSRLRASLSKKGLESSVTSSICEEVEKDDPFLAAQELLVNEHKRMQYLKENFVYIEPREIILNEHDVRERNASKALMHYVSLCEIVTHLVNDPTFKIVATKHKPSTDSILRDVKDGNFYKESEYFKANPEALTAILYSDAVELSNPLGAARGKHKVIQFFITFGEIPKEQRSKVDRIQLVAIVKEKVLKHVGIRKVFEPLITDLKRLETGILVDEHTPHERLVKCGLLMYCADNLEAYIVGGFSQSFSSKSICRHCHIQFSDLDNDIHNYGSKCHDAWNRTEYDKIAKIADRRNKIHSQELCFTEESFDDSGSEEGFSGEEELDGSEIMYGIKYSCPLNELQSFHCTQSLPVDVMHDVFEGSILMSLL